MPYASRPLSLNNQDEEILDTLEKLQCSLNHLSYVVTPRLLGYFRVQINFSEVYCEKLSDRNLFVLVSPKGPYAENCWKTQFAM